MGAAQCFDSSTTSSLCYDSSSNSSVQFCRDVHGPCDGLVCLTASEYTQTNDVGSARSPPLEDLLRRLFYLQDLKGDDLLEEQELMKLNEKLAMLHYGKDINRHAVKDKYSELFRSKLDPDGRPVGYDKFRAYMLTVLDDMDPDETSQEMMVEHFVEEAQLARRAFFQASLASESDWAYMPRLSQQSWDALDAQTNARFAFTPSSPLSMTQEAALPLAPTIQIRDAGGRPEPLASLRPTSLTTGSSATVYPAHPLGGQQACNNEYMPLRTRSETIGSVGAVSSATPTSHMVQHWVQDQ